MAIRFFKVSYLKDGNKKWGTVIAKDKHEAFYKFQAQYRDYDDFGDDIIEIAGYHIDSKEIG